MILKHLLVIAFLPCIFEKPNGFAQDNNLPPNLPIVQLDKLVESKPDKDRVIYKLKAPCIIAVSEHLAPSQRAETKTMPFKKLHFDQACFIDGVFAIVGRGISADHQKALPTTAAIFSCKTTSDLDSLFGTADRRLPLRYIDFNRNQHWTEKFARFSIQKNGKVDFLEVFAVLEKEGDVETITKIRIVRNNPEEVSKTKEKGKSHLKNVVDKTKIKSEGSEKTKVSEPKTKLTR
jgi:hypothetical protein